jgi:hypothetical protein
MVAIYLSQESAADRAEMRIASEGRYGLRRGGDRFHFVTRCPFISVLSSRRNTPFSASRASNNFGLSFFGGLLQSLDAFLQRMLQSAAFGPPRAVHPGPAALFVKRLHEEG